MDLPGKHIVLFDGVCNLCNRTAVFIIKRDKKQQFKFAPLQSVAGKKISAQLNLPAGNVDSLVYLQERKSMLRSDAVLHIMKDLGYPWKILFVFILLPAQLRNAVYDFVARNRYGFFGKRDTCMIPSAEITQRFLS
jgi:predicted DCC family thiol-disulfide oxidoreductase YuxK